MTLKNKLSDIYSNRFSNSDRIKKSELWKILCEGFFQKYVGKNSAVMDIGAGYCEFLNNIKAKEKIAVDMNPDIKKFAGKGVKPLNISFNKIPASYNGKMDIIFMGNFLEHLNSKDDVLDVLTKVYKLLNVGGKVLILQPNIDLLKNKYWDFIDHKTVLNSKSIIEGMAVCGFKLNLFIERFLPYTTKSLLFLLPAHLLKIYLQIPPFIRPFAGQSFAVGIKTK